MKWAIREAIDVYFKAKSVFQLGARTIRAGEPVLIFDTVKTSTLEVASAMSYVTGGKGNARLLSFEGDKTLTFNFEEALLSNEGMAILAGADLIPARNKNLPGASPDARSVIAHYTEKYPVVTNNIPDFTIASSTRAGTDAFDRDNTYPADASIVPAQGAQVSGKSFFPPRGGVKNVWLTKKPYVGQNAEIYVMLLDEYGEMSGAPLQINLANNMPSPAKVASVTFSEDGTSYTLPAGFLGASQIASKTITIGDGLDVNETGIEWSDTQKQAFVEAITPENKRSYLAKFTSGMKFIAFDKNGQPMVNLDAAQVAVAVQNQLLPSNALPYPDPISQIENATFDDKVGWYVDITNLAQRIIVNTGEDSDTKPYIYTVPTDSIDSELVSAVPTKDGIKYTWTSTDAAAAGYATYAPTSNWVTSWGDINLYIRQISATIYGNAMGDYGPSILNGTVSGREFTVGTNAGFTTPIPTDAASHPLTSKGGAYAYLLAPSGGVAQPVAYREGSQYVYKVNVPSVLYQDIVLLDYYQEYQHDATQVSILPDKFAPYMYVEGSSLVRRASDGMDLPAEFVIPKFKITTALSFTMQSTGDPSTFSFSGDAYPDFSKFDLTRKVLADIQILDADDNYDGASGAAVADDPTSYRRFKYNEDTDGEYLWKDPSIAPHQNIDYSDAYDYNDPNQETTYKANVGGPETRTDGAGVIDTDNT